MEDRKHVVFLPLSFSSDHIETLFEIETDDIEGVEKCVKLVCKRHQYRKKKEVYEIDLDTLKEIMSSCKEFYDGIKDIFEKDKKKVKEAINFFLKEDGKDPYTIWFYTNDLEGNKKELRDFIKTFKFIKASPTVQLQLLAQWCASEEKLLWIINNQEFLNRGNRR